MADKSNDPRLAAWKKLFGKCAPKDGVDEMNAILLQIVLAVMLIFMIAFFLFMGKVDGEISQIDELHQKMEQADRNELLHAVDQVTQQYRIRYGLTEFLHIDPATGEKTFDFSDVIARGKTVGATPEAHAFQLGAQNAFADYRDLTQYEAQWIAEIRKIAPDAADKNSAWLHGVVRERIASLKLEVIEVQQLAAAAIQQHLALHPGEVHDAQISALLAQLENDPDPGSRKVKMAELGRQLKKLAYRRLTEICQTPMLAEEEK